MIMMPPTDNDAQRDPGPIDVLSISAKLNYDSIYVYSAAILFEMFLYGFYTALFIICIRVLTNHQRTTQKVMLACAIILYGLATCDVILALAYLYWFVIRDEDIPDKNLHYKFLIYITSNIVADALVIYRCFTVWNNDRRIIILPSLMLLGGSVCGYLFIGLSDEEYRFRVLLDAFLFTTVVLNIIVTTLMAGRIWWISKKARAILGPGLSKKYKAAITIIIESGVIYSLYILLDVVLGLYPLDAGLSQVVGIVPTMIIVQVGLGRNTQDVDTSVSMIRTEGRGMTTCDSTMEASPTTMTMSQRNHEEVPEYAAS